VRIVEISSFVAVSECQARGTQNARDSSDEHGVVYR
jgi:hypothetical protein